MGSVYKARDTRLDRVVALKILRKNLSATPVEAARLQMEARVAAAIKHPNVVQVFSSGSDHDQFYLVMELVEHGSLDDLIVQEGRLSEAQVLQTGLQVAQGLKAASEKGLIHRDIKPANILFTDEHTAKIGDFGLAIAAEKNAGTRNEIWGTPYYVAPERLNNEPEDFRSDIYSLGATLFHAIAGSPPFEGKTKPSSALRELKGQPLDLAGVAPGVSGPTARLINRMMEPNPDARFSSYEELIAGLQRAQKRPGARLARALWVAVPLLLIAGGIAFYFHEERVAHEKNVARLFGENAAHISLQHMFDAARGELIAGKYESARLAFISLASEARHRQPLLNWLKMHRGLAALLRGFTTQARQAFQEIERSGSFSKKPEDAPLARFFVETAGTMVAPASIPANGVAEPDPKTPQAFARFLFAVKDWQQADFANAAALFEQFARSQPEGVYSWINDYKPLAQKFLSDYRIYADWKDQTKNLATAEQVATALSALRAAEQKLQLRGRLADTLREEELTLSQPTATPGNP